MTTDRPRRRGLAPVAVIGVLLLLVVAASACSSKGSPNRVAAGGDDLATSTTAVPTTTAASESGDAVDGELALSVEGARATLTVTAGAEPLVALTDLSLAEVEAAGSSWSVVVARPAGPRSSTADLPDVVEAVLVQPGDWVEVGPYELGPRPPTELSLCLEVVLAGEVTARNETGTQILLAPRTGPPSTLCATTRIG